VQTLRLLDRLKTCGTSCPVANGDYAAVRAVFDGSEWSRVRSTVRRVKLRPTSTTRYNILCACGADELSSKVKKMEQVKIKKYRDIQCHEIVHGRN
jgi:hypothetical protein